MFRIVRAPIESAQAACQEFTARHSSNPELCALLYFEERVRRQSYGRDVVSLDFECVESLCLAVGKRVSDETRQKFPIIDLCCVHRTGTMYPGDIICAVAILAAHWRNAAEAYEFFFEHMRDSVQFWQHEVLKELESSGDHTHVHGPPGAA